MQNKFSEVQGRLKEMQKFLNERGGFIGINFGGGGATEKEDDGSLAELTDKVQANAAEVKRLGENLEMAIQTIEAKMAEKVDKSDLPGIQEELLA